MHDSVNIMPAYGPPGAVHFRFLKKRMVGACGVRWNLGTLYGDHPGDAIQFWPRKVLDIRFSGKTLWATLLY